MKSLLYGDGDLCHRPMARTPRGAGEKVMYLDFDGVLHHHNVLWHPKRGAYLCAPSEYQMFQHVGLLETLLDPCPEIKIVLSTAWVRVYSFDRASKRLPLALRQRVIGATFHSRMDQAEFLAMSRGMQVWFDVQRRNPKAWIALDDDHLDWPAWCLDQYVRTDENKGISEPTVFAQIEAKLAHLGYTCNRI